MGADLLPGCTALRGRRLAPWAAARFGTPTRSEGGRTLLGRRLALGAAAHSVSAGSPWWRPLPPGSAGSRRGQLLAPWTPTRSGDVSLLRGRGLALGGVSSLRGRRLALGATAAPTRSGGGSSFRGHRVTLGAAAHSVGADSLRGRQLAPWAATRPGGVSLLRGHRLAQRASARSGDAQGSLGATARSLGGASSLRGWQLTLWVPTRSVGAAQWHFAPWAPTRFVGAARSVGAHSLQCGWLGG